MFDFPSSPTNGQVFTSGSTSYAFDGTGWKMQGTAPGAYVLKTGDTMTGALIVNSMITSKGGVAGGYGRISIDDAGGAFNTALSFYHGGVLGNEITCNNSDTIFGFATPATSKAWVQSTVPSTSPTTGALTVAGGVGIGGELYSVGNHFITGSGGGLGG